LDLLQQPLKFAMTMTLQAETEFTMKTYVAIIGGKAVLAFRAEDDRHLRHSPGEGLRDLHALIKRKKAPHSV
jgi:hypothetical protein